MTILGPPQSTLDCPGHVIEVRETCGTGPSSGPFGSAIYQFGKCVKCGQGFSRTGDQWSGMTEWVRVVQTVRLTEDDCKMINAWYGGISQSQLWEAKRVWIDDEAAKPLLHRLGIME